MSVQGRDLLTGKPKQVEVSYREIAKALDKSIQRIEDAVMETLSQTPPELAAHLQHGNLSCWWRIYVEETKNFKKTDLLFTLLKIH
jgi:hypothetical protein